MQIVSQRTFESAPAKGIYALGRAAIGAGLGLLIAARFSRSTRNATAIGLLALGVAANLPSVVAGLNELINGPESNRGLQKRLRSIRRDIDVPIEDVSDETY